MSMELFFHCKYIVLLLFKMTLFIAFTYSVGEIHEEHHRYEPKLPLDIFCFTFILKDILFLNGLV